MHTLFRNWPALSLLTLDIAGLTLCLYMAFRVRIGFWLGGGSWALVLAIAVTVLAFYILGLYSTGGGESPSYIALKAIVAAIVAGVAVTTLTYIGGVERLKGIPLLWRSVFPFGMLFFAAFAAGVRLIVLQLVRSTKKHRNWLVIGDSVKVQRLLRDFTKLSINENLRVLTDNQSIIGKQQIAQHSAIQKISSSDLEQGLGKSRWQGVIVSDTNSYCESVVSILMKMRSRGVRIFDISEFYEQHWSRVPIFSDDDRNVRIAEEISSKRHEIALNAKRVIDVVSAFLIFILFAPIFLLAAIAIKLDSSGGVFYRQIRVGSNGKHVTINKFRTMTEDAEKEGVQWAAIDDPRVTRVGRVLRRWRIDELPQMWNVVLGEMSLIGPRPERPELISTLEKEIPLYDMRHIVKPGITGWAQVKHPYGSSVEDARRKLEFDFYYIKNYSLVLDLIIAIKTLRIVAAGVGR